MELWVRSQDKEALTKVNMGIMYWEDVNKRNCIVNKDNATGYSILGAYKTKERCKEILEDIQKHINKISTFEYRQRHLVLELPNNVFIMREE